MNGRLQRMIELGVITAPKHKTPRSAFEWMDRVISEEGQNTGALDALKTDREDGR
jgi:hypothetical protein